MITTSRPAVASTGYFVRVRACDPFLRLYLCEYDLVTGRRLGRHLLGEYLCRDRSSKVERISLRVAGQQALREARRRGAAGPALLLAARAALRRHPDAGPREI